MRADALNHLFVQLVNGEFALANEEAKTMTADEFATKYQKTVRPWGLNGCYRCVVLDGIEYLWLTDTGDYDGWNMAVES